MVDMTLGQFARHINRIAARSSRREVSALFGSGTRLVFAARSYIGTYQGAVGRYPAWQPLSVNTLQGGVSPTGYRYPGKIELGYSPGDNPLLRTGQMRQSIQSTVRGNSVIIGSNDEVALWQELGTQGSASHVPIPPRSFLGRALAEHGRRETHAIARVVFKPLLTGRP